MTKSRSLLRWGLVGGVVGAISLAASASQAQVNVYNDGGLNLDVGVTAGIFYGQTRNTYFGAGGNFGYTVGQRRRSGCHLGRGFRRAVGLSDL